MIHENLASYIMPGFKDEFIEPIKKNLRSKPQSNSADVRTQIISATKIVENFENPKYSEEKYQEFFGNNNV